MFLGLLNTAHASEITYTASTSQEIIYSYAVEYGIPFDSFDTTLKCESDFNPSAIGDHGTSLGIAQIHLPAHPDITEEEATDPIWAINFTAKEFSEGHANLWSCYNNLYGKSGLE